MNDRTDALERLVALRDKGALTDEEFQREKSKIIGQDQPAPVVPGSNDTDRSITKAAKIFIGVFVLVIIIYCINLPSAPSSSSPSEPVCSKADAWFYAEDALKAQLKNPDEADFENPLAWPVEDDPLHAGQYIVTGVVTATNSFNAKIKSKFKAVVRCDKGTWYTGKVTIE